MRPQQKLNLNEEQIVQLKEIIKSEKKHRTVHRAQALLLRYKGMSVADISFTLDVRIETVYIWIKNYKKDEQIRL